MLSDSERLYILIVQYGLARDAEYENKIKRLQGLIFLFRGVRCVGSGCRGLVRGSCYSP